MERLLGDLCNDQLRRLCVALRSRCLQQFAAGAERESVRQEAVAGLEDEATTRYLQCLERRRDEERAALVEAAERGRQLRRLLEGRKGNLTSSRSSTSMAASVSGPTSRSNSRPRTPLYTPSETRPGS